MHYRYLFHNTQSKRFRRVLHFKGVCDKQKINLKQVWVNLIKCISLCMYSFIFMQDNWEILMKERKSGIVYFPPKCLNEIHTKVHKMCESFNFSKGKGWGLLDNYVCQEGYEAYLRWTLCIWYRWFFSGDGGGADTATFPQGLCELFSSSSHV